MTVRVIAKALGLSLGLSLGLGLLLSGCGQSAPEVAGGPASHTGQPSSSPRPSPSLSPSPTGSTPELPPGDPGLDASAVPDPGKPEQGHTHDEPARRSVPSESMLDERTVSGVLGGRWHKSTGGPWDCAVTPGGVADRTAVYRSAGGYLQQTVTTHPSPAVADREVGKADLRVRACGWTVQPDPRLGSASVAAAETGEGRSVVVVAVDGVTVTLVGSGSATVNPARWTSLADLALGNACAAAADGCH